MEEAVVPQAIEERELLIEVALRANDYGNGRSLYRAPTITTIPAEQLMSRHKHLAGIPPKARSSDQL